MLITEDTRYEAARGRLKGALTRLAKVEIAHHVATSIAEKASGSREETEPEAGAAVGAECRGRD